MVSSEAMFDKSNNSNNKEKLSSESLDPLVKMSKKDKLPHNESSKSNSSGDLLMLKKLLIFSIVIATSCCIIFTVYLILPGKGSPTLLFTRDKANASGVLREEYLDGDIEIAISGVQFRKKMKRDVDVESDNNSEISSTTTFAPRAIPSGEKCQIIPEVSRFDCHPQSGASQSACEGRGCCWNPGKDSKTSEHDSLERVPLNVPSCYYPKDWISYEYVESAKDGNDFSGIMSLKAKSFYKNDISRIRLQSTSLSDSILRVKIDDPDNVRYEPQWPAQSNWDISRTEDSPPKYIFETDATRSGFAVKRAADNSILFDSIGKGGFTFSDQFLQIHSSLPSHNIYGLGEHRTQLKLNTSWQSLTMFNRAKIPVEEVNLYGSHPFYYVIEDSGNCHGVLFLNSNAMDAILQPAPAITFRTIGGIFDIYFFLGPKPADVLRQYSEIVGKPYFPPYWGLGFHLSKYGYRTLAKTKEVWNRTRNAEIPYDTQWNDIDYLDQNNAFTLNKNDFQNLPQFLEELHSVGMHHVPMIYAGVTSGIEGGNYPPYDEGIRDNIFIKDAATNQPFVGRVEDIIPTVWPDFTNPNTTDYYYRMLKALHEKFPFDGAWIDMNEPVNDNDGLKGGCPQNDLDYPQYVPNVDGGLLATQTLCMNAKHHFGPHYNLHNTYAIEQAVATALALPRITKKRPFIISRATWVGLGRYAGHFTGDEYSTWHDMRMSIPVLLSHSLFQVPLTGTDICGFNRNTTVPLCNRWVQLGAFYPFARNHNCNDTIEQDPVAMGDSVVNSAKTSLSIRYKLLPYLYTLFFKAHKFGDTVARPLFIEFIDDKNTYDIDTHFLWGGSLLIIPVLKENEVTVDAYIPRGVWYDYYSKIPISSTGENVTFSAPLDRIPLLIRGGSILPAQTPNVTTALSRKNKFELLVALDENEFASGELYWDDGESIDSVEARKYKWLEFTVRDQTLRNREIEEGNYSEDIILGKVSVMGSKRKVSRVILNGDEVDFAFDDQENQLNTAFNVEGLNVDLKTNFTLSWTYVDPE